jgi:hypothetical protein
LRWDTKRVDGVEVTIDVEPHDTDAHDVHLEVVGYIALH